MRRHFIQWNMGTDGLVGEVVSRLADIHSGTDSYVTDVVIGENLVFIEVSCAEEQFVGVAHRPPVAFPATSTIVGAEGIGIAAWAVDPPADVSFDAVAARSLGVATMNALSVSGITWSLGDPMGSISTDVSVIATVGLFAPALRKFGARDVRIIERNRLDPNSINAPDSVAVSTYQPDAVHTAFAGVDVLFITGSTAVYGGLDSSVAAATDISTVIVIGATASFVPDPLFEAGVSMIAGARVSAPDRVKSGILAGKCASDLHQFGLEKVFVSASEDLPGLDVVSNES